MHLFLQICGVAGFSVLGHMMPALVMLRSGKLCSIDGKINYMCAYSFALISTYFIFG